jgi:hypothetical protein
MIEQEKRLGSPILQLFFTFLALLCNDYMNGGWQSVTGLGSGFVVKGSWPNCRAVGYEVERFSEVAGVVIIVEEFY